MIKIKQLVSGLLLKFNEFDSYDLGLLMYELSKNYEVDMKDFEIASLKDYIKVNDEVVSLNDKITFDTQINNYGIKLRRKLEVMQGRDVKGYLDNISTEEFVLRKIKYLNDVSVLETDEYLRLKDQNVLEGLFEYGYLTTVWNDDVNEDNYQVIKLTQKAKLSLFIIDNIKEINRFKKELISLNYDYTLIDNYLMAQDLDDDLDKILNAEKFYNYCLGFNIYPYMPKYKERKLYSN